MFFVTLVNLSPDAATVVEGGGPKDLGLLSAADLTKLLNTFAEIDAVQNMKADPEIRIQSKRDRFIVRTGQRKLFLYDARRLAEPAFVLEASEIIAELDGSAAARRTAPPIAFSTPESGDAGRLTASGETSFSSGDYVPPTRVESRRWTFALLACAVALAVYAAYANFSSDGDEAPPALTPLAPTERLAEDAALTGVYVTGNEPGHHGIVILGDGRLKLFAIFAQAAPGVVPGTYRLGRRNASIWINTDQPGGQIRVVDRETLEYGGETYRRVP